MKTNEKLDAGQYENKLPFVGIKRDAAAYWAYSAEDARIKEQFRKDLAEDYEVVGHPKEPIVWRIAWDRGHASGFREVAMEYAEIVELIQGEK